MKKIKLELIIESQESILTGSVTYHDHLIVDRDPSLQKLEEKLKVLLFEFEGLEPNRIEFEHFYDVYSLFQQFDFLKISKVAQHAGIHAGLLRQYASQVKYPSANQAKKIENTIHELAEQMMHVSLHVA